MSGYGTSAFGSGADLVGKSANIRFWTAGSTGRRNNAARCSKLDEMGRVGLYWIGAIVAKAMRTRRSPRSDGFEFVKHASIVPDRIASR